MEYLPYSIGNLTSLERLPLQNNVLSKLPDSFAKLTGIRFLSLWNRDNTPKMKWDREATKKILPRCRLDFDDPYEDLRDLLPKD